MVHILNKGKKQSSVSLSDKVKKMTLDELHLRRKRLEEEMKDGLMSKDEMNMLDCNDEDEEIKRLYFYEKWKNVPINGVTNEQRMFEWSEINREFKRRNEEGRVHSMDDLRNKKMKYD